MRRKSKKNVVRKKKWKWKKPKKCQGLLQQQPPFCLLSAPSFIEIPNLALCFSFVCLAFFFQLCETRTLLKT